MDKDPLQKDSFSSGHAQATEVDDRRAYCRQPFNAVAELVELASGAQLTAKTSDLGPQGCYIDTLNPFPEGTAVRVILHHGDATFEASGNVIYFHAGLGMGLVFTCMAPDQRAVLEKWLGGPSLGFDSSHE